MNNITKEELLQNIDIAITNKTEINSITPEIHGEILKAVVEWLYANITSSDLSLTDIASIFQPAPDNKILPDLTNGQVRIYFVNSSGVYKTVDGSESISISEGERALIKYNGEQWEKITIENLAQDISGQSKDKAISQYAAKIMYNALYSLINNKQSGETNIIESISVNGDKITPDGNKNVEITIPEAGEENIIETIKVNNSALTVSNKSVNIDLSHYIIRELNSADLIVGQNTLLDDDDLLYLWSEDVPDRIKRLAISQLKSAILEDVNTPDLTAYLKKDTSDDSIISAEDLNQEKLYIRLWNETNSTAAKFSISTLVALLENGTYVLKDNTNAAELDTNALTSNEHVYFRLYDDITKTEKKIRLGILVNIIQTRMAEFFPFKQQFYRKKLTPSVVVQPDTWGFSLANIDVSSYGYASKEDFFNHSAIYYNGVKLYPDSEYILSSSGSDKFIQFTFKDENGQTVIPLTTDTTYIEVIPWKKDNQNSE